MQTPDKKGSNHRAFFWQYSVPGGLAGPPLAGQPENGWWWNPAESGRGFFIEWQNGQGGPQADLAGYM